MNLLVKGDILGRVLVERRDEEVGPVAIAHLRDGLLVAHSLAELGRWVIIRFMTKSSDAGIHNIYNWKCSYSKGVVGPLRDLNLRLVPVVDTLAGIWSLLPGNLGRVYSLIQTSPCSAELPCCWQCWALGPFRTRPASAGSCRVRNRVLMTRSQLVR